MLKTGSMAAAFALTAVLGMPADAQSPPAWTQAGMLRCVVNPSIGFIIAGHQSMECRFTQNAPNPPQAYEGALNMIGLNIGIGRRVRLGRVGADGWHTGRSSRRRICGRERGHRPRPRRWRKRLGRGLCTHVRVAAGLVGRFGCRRRRPRCLRTQTAAGVLRSHLRTRSNVRFGS